MLNWERISIIIAKEWLELRRSRGLLLSTFLPPTILPLFALALIFAMGLVSDPDTAEIPAAAVDPTLTNLRLEASAQVIFRKTVFNPLSAPADGYPKRARLVQRRG
ncbi:hypothetical protein [Chloroflexus aggregans]|uniref:hypothetical protein n=1 Tax=Chloroflexus aggregans TaxID=152260 RepID=UPI0002E73B3B|nr:hypothetical protein [Chloroflexus aggregans]